MKARSDKPNSTTARKAMNGMWSTPHNWCDRRCDRCRLALDCEVNLACVRRRAEHEVRGEDPDSPETMAEDLRHTLESAVHMVEQLAREAEIDLSEPLPPPPVAGGAVCVQRAGEQVLRALAELQAPLAGASEALADAAEETIAQWSLLVAKAARVFSYTVEFDPDTWAQDAEPNLLLMQHVRGSFSRLLQKLQRELREGNLPDDVRDGVDAFDSLLAPMFDAVSGTARRCLEVFIAHGVAPSPFSTNTTNRKSARVASRGAFS